MNFSVKVSGFKKAISHVVDVSTKDVVKDSIGENKIVLSANKQSITASAFNGRVSIVEELSDINNDDLLYSCDGTGEIIVNAKDLSRTLDSFAPSEMVIFDDEGDNTELCIKKKKDKDQYQTLPYYKDAISFPPDAKTFEKTVEIRRDIFLVGIDRTFFTIGFEEERERYMYWVLRANKGSVRFASGTGGIFSVADFEGKDLVTSTPDETSILFPKGHTGVVYKILSSLDCDNVTIKQSSTKDKSPYQIIISTKSMELKLVGMNPSVTWVDESTFLDAEYNCKVVADVSELEWASRGVMATFNEEMQRENRLSRSKVEVDAGKSLLTMETKGVMRALRKVPIVDIEAEDDKDNAVFECSSIYLNDMTKFGSKTKYIQMEMIKNDKKKPIVVRYYANDKVGEAKDMKNQNTMAGISEMFNIFFVQLQ